MSNALAIAGVTAVIRDLLDSGMIDHKVTDATGAGVTVSAIAPDTIALEGTEVQPRLNLFLHQVTPNAAWRNAGLPSRNGNGARLSNPPLALDLHYLVTAYGVTDLQAEVLLGYAMQLLHETPVLSRDAIRNALNPPSAPVDGGLLPKVYQALRASDLAEQYEQVKITPATMNSEEMSKLWSALQAHYRPTAAYQVSVVLIEATAPVRAPLPVLTRGIAVGPDLMPAFPTLETVAAPTPQVAAHLGDTLTVTGHHLDGSNHRLLLSLPRLRIEREVASPSSVSSTTLTFALPNIPADYPAGTWLAAVQLQRPGESEPRVSNQLALAILPQITSLTTPPQIFTRDAKGTAAVNISCVPQVRYNQRASLIIGGREVVADDHPVITGTLTFTVLDAPLGVHYVRLRVDGVDSQLINRDVKPPVYFDHRIQIA
jgi:Pvc16 N-terminal domain